ncbi:MAG: hypothetical protein M0Z54_06695 [Thermaerobacter sp.]|nr:hypothetical protein [Thermaerobacter sp.]
MESRSLASRPAASEELCRCIIRLAAVRQEMRVLETEEQLLRETLDRTLFGWPAEWFPIQVESLVLRRHARVGSLDWEAARTVLSEAGRLEEAPTTLQVVDERAARQFPARVATLGLPKKAVRLVCQFFDEGVAPVPELTTAWVDGQHAAGHLDEEAWHRCFRRGQPIIWVWAVR